VHITTLTPPWGSTGFLSSAGLPKNTDGIEAKIMKPREMGDAIVKICMTPDHLVIPKFRIQPMVQEINPM